MAKIKAQSISREIKVIVTQYMDTVDVGDGFSIFRMRGLRSETVPGRKSKETAEQVREGVLGPGWKKIFESGSYDFDHRIHLDHGMGSRWLRAYVAEFHIEPYVFTHGSPYYAVNDHTKRDGLGMSFIGLFDRAKRGEIDPEMIYFMDGYDAQAYDRRGKHLIMAIPFGQINGMIDGRRYKLDALSAHLQKRTDLTYLDRHGEVMKAPTLSPVRNYDDGPDFSSIEFRWHPSKQMFGRIRKVLGAQMDPGRIRDYVLAEDIFNIKRFRRTEEIY